MEQNQPIDYTTAPCKYIAPSPTSLSLFNATIYCSSSPAIFLSNTSNDCSLSYSHTHKIFCLQRMFRYLFLVY